MEEKGRNLRKWREKGSKVENGGKRQKTRS